MFTYDIKNIRVANATPLETEYGHGLKVDLLYGDAPFCTAKKLNPNMPFTFYETPNSGYSLQNVYFVIDHFFMPQAKRHLPGCISSFQTLLDKTPDGFLLN